jgi:hypothetical protein
VELYPLAIGRRSPGDCTILSREVSTSRRVLSALELVAPPPDWEIVLFPVACRNFFPLAT